MSDVRRCRQVRTGPVPLILAGLLLATSLAAPRSERAGQRRSSGRLAPTQAYGRLPLSFEPNQGQADADVRYLAHGPGYSLALASTEARLVLNSPRRTRSAQRGPERQRHRAGEGAGANALAKGWVNSLSASAASARSAVNEPAVLAMRLAGANPRARVAGAGELPGKVNYCLGNDPTRWLAGLSTYAKVRYEAVYPGIDQVYYGTQGQLEYDFIVHPGADPDQIRLVYDGAERVTADAAGDLVLHTAAGEVRQRRPVAYQLMDGERRLVDASYVFLPEGDEGVGVGMCGGDPDREAGPVFRTAPGTQGPGPKAPRPHPERRTRNSARETPTHPHTHTPTPSRTVAFNIGEYDHSRPLVIDPVIEYSTFVTLGSRDTAGEGIAVDGAGNAYVTGHSVTVRRPNPNSPFLTSDRDVLVVKLDPSGSRLLYSTVFGGTRGDDEGQAIAVDRGGNACLTGKTKSPDFPTRSPAQAVFGGVGVDDTTLEGDAFVAKLGPGGSPVYSTFLGGRGSDGGFGIAVDPPGNAYVMGNTTSSNFPTRRAFQPRLGGSTDVFVAKFNPGGALQYSTYLGGRASENFIGRLDVFTNRGGITGEIFANRGGGIGVDSTGSAVVTGYTSSANFPTFRALDRTIGGQADPSGSYPYDVFVTRFSPDGSRLVYSTYLGGSRNDRAYAIALDGQGSAYVTGVTFSRDYPTKDPFQASGDLFQGDLFISKLAPDGSSLAYSTYLGGSGFDYGYGIAVDSQGDAYVTGLTSTFPYTLATADALSPAGSTFVLELNAAGSELVYATPISGIADLPFPNAGFVAGNAIAVDPTGDAYVTGAAFSREFPTTGGALQTSFAGARAMFVTRLAHGEPFLPAAPTMLTARATSSTQIQLNWRDNSTNETGYFIYQVINDQVRLLDYAPPNSTSYTATGLTPDTQYSYIVQGRIVGYGTAGSNVATARTQRPGRLRIGATALDFGTVRIGSRVRRDLVIENMGQGALTVTVSASFAPFRVVSGAGTLTINAGSRAIVGLEFAPTARGIFRGVVSIRSSAVSSPTTDVGAVNVLLAGTGN